jgi:hypothetical protein
MNELPPPLFTPADALALQNAVEVLENPGLAARLAGLLGMPLDAVLKRLPEGASSFIATASEAALRKALAVALLTLREGARAPARRLHLAAATTTGALGGAAGLAGLVIELPITTTILFRAIADQARAEGEDLRQPDAVVACLQVFAFGGPRQADDAVESGYLAVRLGLYQAVREATLYLARGAADAEAPLLARLIAALASRFGLVVSYKTAAQLAPVIGAVGGAAVNALFMAHFQDMASGHFTVRRLERTYGTEAVQQAYLELVRQSAPAPRNTTPPPPALPPPA